MTRKLLFVVFTLMLTLPTPSSGQSLFPMEKAPDKKKEMDIPKIGYVHVGLGGNFFVVSSFDIQKAIEPFKLGAVNFGYLYNMNLGLRNIVQFEYRWGKDSNSLFYDEGYTPTSGGTFTRTSIDMTFDYSQWLIKVNPIFSLRKMRTWVFFIVWGKGSVDYSDKNGDGFLGGTKSVAGIEFGRVLRFLEVSGSIEKHSMTFERFDIEGFEPDEREFDASYLQFNVKLAVGLGL